MQVAAGARLCPQADVSTENSEVDEDEVVVVMDVNVKVASPALLTVTGSGALVLPTAVSGNDNDLGETLIKGSVRPFTAETKASELPPYWI